MRRGWLRGSTARENDEKSIGNEQLVQESSEAKQSSLDEEGIVMDCRAGQSEVC